MGRSRLMILAGLTGVGGLGSETLFFKLLDYAVGSAPIIAFVVVATFLAGVGLGALLSPMVRKPWRIEAALALYDGAWLLGGEHILELNASVLQLAIPVLGETAACGLLAVAYLSVPSILLGVSFPAITEKSTELAQPYAIQAVGALLGVVLVEAVLFPFGGHVACLAVLVGVHGAAAALLYGRAFHFSRIAMGPPVLILAAVGAATGAFQGLWLQLSQLLFQPFYFVQPVTVAAMLAGLSIGAAIWRRYPFSFGRSLVGATVGVGVSAGLGALWTQLPQAAFAHTLYQLPLLVLPAAIPIGAILPAYFKDREPDRRSIGAALLSLSLGNAAGLLGAGVLLMPWMAPSASLLAVALVLGGLAIAQDRTRRAALACAGGALIALVPVFTIGDVDLIRRVPGHHDKTLEVLQVFRGPGELSAIYKIHLTPEVVSRRLYQSGFSPIDLDLGREDGIAIAGAAYAPRAGRALVLGAGSGRTAGVVAGGFDHVDVVDLGTTVPALLRALRVENNNLLENERVNYLELDAILAPYVLEPGYDLIVMTVDPSYHVRAQKLYTLESLTRFKRLLAPDGVLIFWSDASSNAEANQVLINTGAAAFEHQRLFIAHPGMPGRRSLGYYFLVHSARPLHYLFDRPHVRAMVALDRVTEKFASEEIHHLPGEGRASPTRAVHRLLRPAASILLGGFNEGKVKVRPN